MTDFLVSSGTHYQVPTTTTKFPDLAAIVENWRLDSGDDGGGTRVSARGRFRPRATLITVLALANHNEGLTHSQHGMCLSSAVWNLWTVRQSFSAGEVPAARASIQSHELSIICPRKMSMRLARAVPIRLAVCHLHKSSTLTTLIPRPVSKISNCKPYRSVLSDTEMASSEPQTPWYAAYPSPRNNRGPVAGVTRETMLDMLKDKDSAAGEDYVIVDLRRTDYEVCSHFSSPSCPRLTCSFLDPRAAPFADPSTCRHRACTLPYRRYTACSRQPRSAGSSGIAVSRINIIDTLLAPDL